MASPGEWDWSRHVVDHLELHASDYEESVRFYETVLQPLGIPSWPEDGVETGFRSNGELGYRDYAPGYYAAFLLDPDVNNVEALFRDVGNPGFAG